MSWYRLLWANLWRRRARTVFTLLSVVSAFLLYGVLAATHYAFVGGIELVGDGRLITLNKVSFTQPLPLAYQNKIASVAGVKSVGVANWIQGYYQEQRNFIPWIATDDAYLDMFEEISITPEARRLWDEERTAAIIGADLAKAYGWKVGDKVPMRSGIWRNQDGTNTWEVTIVGIYVSTNAAYDQGSMLSRYDYFDESRTYGRSTGGWYLIQLEDPAQGAAVSAAVDALFANSSAQTKTATEKAFSQGFASQIGDVGAIVTYVGVAVLFSMLLVTATTMAQAVRERTAELAVLKALGFDERRIMAMVMGEAVLITVLGAALGLGLAWLLVTGLYPALARFMPAFQLTAQPMAMGVALAVALGALAGIWPARQAMRLRVVDALRRA